MRGYGNASGVPVTYAVGSNATCPRWPAPTAADAACWSNASAAAPYYSPYAAPALAAAAAAAARADVVVVALGLGSRVEAEGLNRERMTLPPVQQELLRRVSAAARARAPPGRVVGVVVSAGGVDWDESLVDAALWAPYGGMQAGPGLADALFGAANPSARLPVTVYRDAWAAAMDCPAPASGAARHATCPTSLRNLNLEAGVGRTYRYLSPANAHTYVRHAFGFGLSYAAFRYAALTASVSGAGVNATLRAAVTITNTGGVAGRDVAQLYATYTGANAPAGLVMPLVNLVAFAATDVLAPGAAQTVAFDVDVGDRLATALDDGSREVLGGTYALSAGGHQPGDAEGTAGSSGPNVQTTVVL